MARCPDRLRLGILNQTAVTLRAEARALTQSGPALQLGDRLYVAADVAPTRLQVGAQTLVAGYLLVTPTILGVVTRLVVR